jgi:hypothetical protein
MSHFTADQHHLRHAYANYMSRQIEPHVAVTATLCQSRSYDGSSGLVWKKGDPILYEGVFRGLVKRLSREVLGRQAVRHGKDLAAGGVIEGDGIDQLYHAHLFLRRPDHLAAEDFERSIRVVFAQSPWLKPDLDIREIKGGWVWYAHKRNPETFMYL